MRSTKTLNNSHQFYKLTQQQKIFIQNKLPKNYNLLPKDNPSKDTNNNPPYQYTNANGIDIRLTKTQSAQKRHKKQKRALKQKQQAKIKKTTSSSYNPKSNISSQNQKKYSQVKYEAFNKKSIKNNFENYDHGYRQNDHSYRDIFGNFENNYNDSLFKQSNHHQKHNSGRHKKKQQTEKIRQTLSEKDRQTCFYILNKLKSSKSSWPFHAPVDPLTQGVPDYPEIIKQPMDLKTIQKKLKLNHYQHSGQFHQDINKIFLNSYKFNKRQTQYFYLTYQLEQQYHQIMSAFNKQQTKQMAQEILPQNQYHNNNPIYPRQQNQISLRKPLRKEQNSNNYTIQQKNRKTKDNGSSLKVQIKGLPKYNVNDRYRIARKFQKLSSDAVDAAFQYIISTCQTAYQVCQNYVKIDFQNMNYNCLWRLDKYLQEIQKQHPLL